MTTQSNENKPQAKYRKDYQAPSHLIQKTDLYFNLNEAQTRVIATSTVTQNGESNTLSLVGEQLNLVKLLVNDVEHSDFENKEGGLDIFSLPKEFTLTIETEIDPVSNTALEGLYKSEGAYCTQCEAEGFRRITYFLDRPDVLAIYTTTIEADKKAYPYLLSNGNKIDAGDLDNGRHWVKWNDPHPKPSYLFALVAGDFDVDRDVFVTRSGRKVDLEIFVDKGNLDRTPHAMLSLKNSMKWDEERFDLEYDLDIYMIVAVDFFNMGAMENKGLNVFNSKFVLANNHTATDADYLDIERVIGHEYFHNWTGNRVTCRDWFQLSLKEGLTVFRDQEFSSDLGSRAVNRISNVRTMRGPQFAEDASPMSHPIRPEKVIEMNNFYTLTVYEKGSEVIRMMHTLLGEARFQKGIKLYFERHDGTAATCDDFVAAMQDASGVDLSQFSLWYSQSGTPQLSVTSRFDEQSKSFTLTVSQTTPSTQDQQTKRPLHIPFDVELYSSTGEIIPMVINGQEVDNVLNVTEESQSFVFENIDEAPIPSLLREFSAPVKLDYDYSDAQLVTLLNHATNAFAKWDAGQMLLAKYIKLGVEAYAKQAEFALSQDVLDAFRGILLNPDLDPAFISEVLTIPSHNEVSGWFETVNVDAIASVLKSIKVQLATELEDEFSATYHSLVQHNYDISHPSIGKRALRNLSLSYLAYLPKYGETVKAHYENANNMTDKTAALYCANSASLPVRQGLMEQFSSEWSHDGLVMDKWFMLQGSNPSSTALEGIKHAMTHSAFSLKNPNRTRSLMSSFFNANPVNFHAIDGSGYQFAGEIIAQMNTINPQVASRLIDPLLKFKRFDATRQQLMKRELEKLRSMDGLAADLFEKVTSALA
ncbi:aminopeptidase N [Vibrio sp. qd031]|uniref:aminopeptidase N n=1 Tax=Vibrio sp. qd031 TaxID=1603038 RepID=UPI000A1157FB|nr:aminopeptidase N [Vibrio sp. qd031]ORT49778.1 aminopeptidase N [Vibrio sp. qd031]